VTHIRAFEHFKQAEKGKKKTFIEWIRKSFKAYSYFFSLLRNALELALFFCRSTDKKESGTNNNNNISNAAADIKKPNNLLVRQRFVYARMYVCVYVCSFIWEIYQTDNAEVYWAVVVHYEALMVVFIFPPLAFSAKASTYYNISTFEWWNVFEN
jgi:hypothetical protein